MHKLIASTLYLMVISIPLIFTTVNSELFEFPKFLLLITGSIVIGVTWLIDSYHHRPIPTLPHLTPLSWAVLAVLTTQALATIFSIDPHTSIWGYYSRFHQGLLTTICYTLIYFASRKYLDNSSTHKLIKISVYTSVLISLYTIAERFGIDKSLWVQDVVNRPFSTLGQPNWLAAYLLPNLFLTLYLSISNKHKSTSPIIHNSIFVILFSALLLTKSRSGLLAFGVSYIAYWALLARNFSLPKIKHSLILFTASCLLLATVIGTPFGNLSILPSKPGPEVDQTTSGTQLESGGTESGDIRKIVWTGALDLVKKRPFLGTGPETFAYSYYWTRPVAHNYTSEWDFLYNKAHNEYLNFAATSGLLGLSAYLFWHYQILRLGLTKIVKSKKANKVVANQLHSLYPTLTASLLGFTITNFFGFSVIPVYLMMIILSALPHAITTQPVKNPPPVPTSHWLSLITASCILITISPLRLFLADLDYAKGKAYLSAGNLTAARTYLEQALAYRPSEPLFHSYLGEIYAQNNQELALSEIAYTKAHNPYHLNYLKSRTKAYLALANLDSNYYQQAAAELEDGRRLAPTDPKLAYNLGLVYSRLNKAQDAINQMQNAIELKRDYYEPYYALTLLFENTKRTELVLPLLEQAESNLHSLPKPLQLKLDQYRQ